MVLHRIKGSEDKEGCIIITKLYSYHLWRKHRCVIVVLLYKMNNIIKTTLQSYNIFSQLYYIIIPFSLHEEGSKFWHIFNWCGSLLSRSKLPSSAVWKPLQRREPPYTKMEYTILERKIQSMPSSRPTFGRAAKPR